MATSNLLPSYGRALFNTIQHSALPEADCSERWGNSFSFWEHWAFGTTIDILPSGEILLQNPPQSGLIAYFRMAVAYTLMLPLTLTGRILYWLSASYCARFNWINSHFPYIPPSIPSPMPAAPTAPSPSPPHQPRHPHFEAIEQGSDYIMRLDATALQEFLLKNTNRPDFILEILSLFREAEKDNEIRIVVAFIVDNLHVSYFLSDNKNYPLVIPYLKTSQKFVELIRYVAKEDPRFLRDLVVHSKEDEQIQLIYKTINLDDETQVINFMIGLGRIQKRGFPLSLVLTENLLSSLPIKTSLGVYLTLLSYAPNSAILLSNIKEIFKKELSYEDVQNIYKNTKSVEALIELNLKPKYIAKFCATAFLNEPGENPQTRKAKKLLLTKLSDSTLEYFSPSEKKDLFFGYLYQTFYRSHSSYSDLLKNLMNCWIKSNENDSPLLKVKFYILLSVAKLFAPETLEKTLSSEQLKEYREQANEIELPLANGRPQDSPAVFNGSMINHMLEREPGSIYEEYVKILDFNEKLETWQIIRPEHKNDFIIFLFKECKAIGSESESINHERIQSINSLQKTMSSLFRNEGYPEKLLEKLKELAETKEQQDWVEKLLNSGASTPQGSP